MTARVVLFDIDGTLLATGGAGRKAMELALADVFQRHCPADRIDTAGRTDCRIITDILESCGIFPGSDERRRFCRAYLKHLPACLKSRRGHVLPGVARLLKLLAARQDVVSGLLTGNCEEGARIKLKHFGLDRFFLFGGFGDVHTDRSDVAAAAWQRAQEILETPIPAEHCCIIGDTPADIQCARAIGASAVAVATGTSTRHDLASCHPDGLLDSLADTDAVLEAVLRGFPESG